MPTYFKEENIRTHEDLTQGPLLTNKKFVLKKHRDVLDTYHYVEIKKKPQHIKKGVENI